MPDTGRISGIGSLADLYSVLDDMEMTAGWTDRDRPILRPEPDTEFRPAHWRYRECRTALDAAGRLIDRIAS